MNRKKQRAKLKPQEYEHRVCAAIEALAAALSGAQLIVDYCLEQQGPEWKSQAPKAAEARRKFQRARTWLKDLNRHD